MINKQTNPNEFFNNPWNAIMVLSVFFVIAPPIQLLVLIYFDHHWLGGRQLLIEIVDVFNNKFLPNFMLSYSIFMVQAVLAGFWCAFTVARGRQLTLSKVIIALIVFGFAIEAIIQIIIFLSDNIAFDWLRMLITVAQAIFAGAVCWFILNKFKWNRPAQSK